MPEEIKPVSPENKNFEPMNPIIDYPEGFDPSTIKGANEQVNAYGDDTNPNDYGTVGYGGANQKNTEEGVANTNINYNKDLKLSDIEGQYNYGGYAIAQGQSEENYLTNRNDNIASALYNEGLTSEADVRAFLEKQQGFGNSTESMRENTVQAIYKRIGQLQQQGEEQEVPNEEAVAEMEQDLNKDTTNTLYGKVGQDSDGKIQTLADKNSVYAQMNEARINNVKALQSMDSEQIAYLLSEGISVKTSQAMRDLQQYDPNKYNAIQAKLKEIQTVETANKIAEGGNSDIGSQFDKDTDVVNSSMSNFVTNTASNERAYGELSTNLNNALSESNVMSTAREQLEEYKRKVNEIQGKINELPSLAKSYFKNDVPQFLVNAFITSRTEKYQAELQKYQELYKSTLDEAKREVEQKQRQEEMDYKWKSLSADINYKNANLNLDRDKLGFEMNKFNANYQLDISKYELDLAKANIQDGKWNDDGTYSYIDLNGFTHTIDGTDYALWSASQNYTGYRMDLLNKDTNNEGVYGGQCETFTDNYAQQYFGERMTGANGNGVTTFEEKQAYCNSGVKKGAIMVMRFKTDNPDSWTYGHTGIVLDYDEATGTITYMDSNHGGDEKVGIYTINANSANIYGFRDPAKGKGGNGVSSNNYGAGFIETPMSAMFDEYVSKHKDNKNAVDDVTKANEAYTILHEMKRNGSMDLLINTELGLLGGLNDEQYGAMLDSILSKFNMIENSSNILLDTMLEYADSAIKEYFKDDTKTAERYSSAYQDMIRLIEIKMRKDSGAAISAGEWRMQFGLYMPTAGKTELERRNAINRLERDSVYSKLPMGTDSLRHNYQWITQSSYELLDETYNESVKNARD